MVNPFMSFKSILDYYIHENTFDIISSAWLQRHRFYHTINHLIDVIRYMENNPEFTLLNVYEKHALLLASFFHDVVYDPRRDDNEDKSIKFFEKSFKKHDPKMLNTVKELINCIKYNKPPSDKLQRIFWNADNNIFNKSFENLVEYESLIRKEYLFVSPEEYKKKRIEFLKTRKNIFGKGADDNIEKLIKYIEKSY